MNKNFVLTFRMSQELCHREISLYSKQILIFHRFDNVELILRLEIDRLSIFHLMCRKKSQKHRIRVLRNHCLYSDRSTLENQKRFLIKVIKIN